MASLPAEETLASCVENEQNYRAIAVIETRLALISSRFITLEPEEIDAAVVDAMKEMGTLLSVDRVYTFFFDPEGHSCSNRHEWCSSGTEPQLENLQRVPTHALPWWMARMNARDDIVLESLDDLPPEAVNERAVLEPQGIRSLLAVPIVWGKRVEGFMGFDAVARARDWPPEYVAPLKLLASIVIGALKRKESEEDLRRTQDSLRELNADLELRVERRTEKLRESLADLKRTQKMLVQQEKLASIGQLAAGIAHEINNPTGYILSNLHIFTDYFGTMTRIVEDYEQLLASFDELPEQALFKLHKLEKFKREQDWEFIKTDAPGLLKESIEGAGRIKEIILGLQSSARTDTGEERLVSIEDVLERALRVSWNEIKFKCVIDKRYAGTPPTALRENQMLQVFLNLLINAAQSIRGKGRITLATELRGETVFASVEDTGIGIPEEQLAKIFDPFFTTKEVGSGTGLGLSITQNIVRAHGGTIEANSVPGRGSTFTVALPIRVPA